MEYSLPEPEGIAFAAELMAPLAELTSVTMVTGFEQIYSPDEFPAKNLSFIFHKYAVAFDLKLRDQQQAAKVMEAALLTLRSQLVHVHFLIFLVTLYQKNSQLYHTVAKARSVDLAAFTEIINNSTLSQFSVPNYADDGGHIAVSIKEVGQVYFSLIRGEQFTAPRTYNFPASMIVNSRDERSRKALNSYIEIVRRAGQFST
jgi:hypothetical protein